MPSASALPLTCLSTGSTSPRSWPSADHLLPKSSSSPGQPVHRVGCPRAKLSTGSYGHRVGSPPADLSPCPALPPGRLSCSRPLFRCGRAPSADSRMPALWLWLSASVSTQTRRSPRTRPHHRTDLPRHPAPGRGQETIRTQSWAPLIGGDLARGPVVWGNARIPVGPAKDSRCPPTMELPTPGEDAKPAGPPPDVGAAFDSCLPSVRGCWVRMASATTPWALRWANDPHRSGEITLDERHFPARDAGEAQRTPQVAPSPVKGRPILGGIVAAGRSANRLKHPLQTPVPDSCPNHPPTLAVDLVPVDRFPSTQPMQSF